MKGVDDVFHRTIIALERLEAYLELERHGEAAAKLQQTAVKTDRDLHDDKQNPPNRESVLGEVQLQCSALFFQTKFDDQELFERTMRFFLTDLLEWYGGRGKEVPFDEVEMYAIPIIVSLSREVQSVMDIMNATDQYVTKLRRIEDLSEEEKERAVEEGFTAFIKAQHHTGEQMQEFSESGADVQLTVHRRGTAQQGYERLMRAMVSLYAETTPAKTVRNVCTRFVENLPQLTDEQIEQTVARLHQSPTPEADTTPETAPEQTPEQPQEQPQEPTNILKGISDVVRDIRDIFKDKKESKQQ